MIKKQGRKLIFAKSRFWYGEHQKIEPKTELQQLKDDLRLRDAELGKLRGELKAIREMKR